MKEVNKRWKISMFGFQDGEMSLYPVKNNAPPLPQGQRPSLRGRSPSGAEPGPAAAKWLCFRIIPAGFNAPLEFLTGFTF